jgi:hypothetical protein
MSRWYRAYAGMVRDEKLVRVAVRTKQPVERVVWVWGAILESAAEIDDAGRYEFDAAEAAYFLRADEADICAIETGLADAGRVAGGGVVKWGDRQFQSDRSAKRQKRYRDNKRQNENSGSDDESEAPVVTVTAASRHGDSPDNIDIEQNVDEVGRARDFAGELNALRSAAGDCLNPTAPALEHLAEVSRWLAGGADFKLDVLPTIAAVGKSAKRRSVNSWAYFTQAIADARERRSAPMPAASPSPANGISQHEPRKPTGVAAVARRIAGEYREQERMASAEILQLPSGGRG